MSSTYTARSTTREHVKERVLALDFPAVGERYSHSDANMLLLGIHRVLRATFNPRGGSNGMEELARASNDPQNPSVLAAIKTTDVATADDVLAEAKAEADKKNKGKAEGDKVAPTVTARTRRAGHGSAGYAYGEPSLKRRLNATS